MKVWACSGICGTLVFLALSIPSSPGFQLSGISLPKVPGGKGQRLVLRESTVSGSLYLGRSGTLPCLGLGQVRSRAVGGCRSMLRMVETAGSKVEMAESSSRAAELPWKESIGGADCELLYMPFIEWQLEFLRKNVGIEDLEFDKTFERQESDVKPAIIESWQFRSKDFRKIRMTYIDAGVNAQVFNCVWYPEYTYDIPIFGIDFLSFGKKKVLAVLDFQPLTQDPEYISKYIEDVKPLREKYLDLCGRMSSRFYDENRFFSEQLLFGKFDHAGPVMRSLFPAFKQYTEVRRPPLEFFAMLNLCLASHLQIR